MTVVLAGKVAQEFVEWLEKAKWLLPPKMSISEARDLFQRKQKEEQKLDEVKSKKKVC